MTLRASRQEFDEAVKHWRTLGVGEVDEKTYTDMHQAKLTRHCRLDESAHVVHWVEVQALVAGPFAHYNRTQYGDEVTFRVYVSRPLDEQDSVPQEVHP